MNRCVQSLLTAVFIAVGLWPGRHGALAADEPPTPTVLKGHKRPVQSLVYSADGKTLVSASDDHEIKVWDPATGK